MLVIANNLGVLPKFFFPTTAGPDYELSPCLADFRRDFTVFSGLSHPGVTGGHATHNCFLTAAHAVFKAGFRNSISLDQFAVEQIGRVTRFPTLNLGVNILNKGNRSLSWTRDGGVQDQITGRIYSIPSLGPCTHTYARMVMARLL